MSVCYLLTVLGVAVSLEIVLHRYFCSFPDLIANHDDLGWNNVNGVGALLLLTIPACWYLITRNKHVVLSLLSIVIIYTGVFLTKSDGCIGTALVFIPVLALFSVFRGDNFHKNVLAKIFLVVLLIMVAIAGFALTKTSVKSVWDFLILKLSNDTNRTLLYKEALELFKAFPILGVGQGYYNPDGWLITSAVVAYNFHSTFFHVLATMGIVGVIVYIYYFVQRYRILMHNNSAFNLFMFFAFTMYEIYAMVDTGEFNVMPALLVVTLTIIFVEYINEKGNDGALPLQLK
jgi:O-antigen ligase